MFILREWIKPYLIENELPSNNKCLSDIKPFTLYNYKFMNNLEQNMYNLDWDHLSKNPNSFDILAGCLSMNPDSINILDENEYKISWKWLSLNPRAINLLKKNIDKINWEYLSENENAIHLLEKNIDKICWKKLSRNPNAIYILEENLDKVDWKEIYNNPNIFTYDYDSMKQIRNPITEELMITMFHPRNINKFELWGFD